MTMRRTTPDSWRGVLNQLAKDVQREQSANTAAAVFRRNSSDTTYTKYIATERIDAGQIVSMTGKSPLLVKPARENELAVGFAMQPANINEHVVVQWNPFDPMPMRMHGDNGPWQWVPSPGHDVWNANEVYVYYDPNEYATRRIDADKPTGKFQPAWMVRASEPPWMYHLRGFTP